MMSFDASRCRLPAVFITIWNGFPKKKTLYINMMFLVSKTNLIWFVFRFCNKIVKCFTQQNGSLAQPIKPYLGVADNIGIHQIDIRYLEPAKFSIKRIFLWHILLFCEIWEFGEIGKIKLKSLTLAKIEIWNP